MTDFTYQEGTPLTWAQMNENLRLMQAKYLDASNSSAIAIAAANFKGAWSGLSGALAVPASVYHSGKFWLLLSNLADVTAATPGVSASWLQVNTGNVQGPGSATAGNVAVLDATGRVLSDGGFAPTALMPKAGGTMTGPARGAVTADNDLSFDMATANNFSCTTTGSGTLTFTNITAGQSGFIRLTNASNHTISAAATCKVGAATLATISVAGTYLLSYFSDDGVNVYVVNSGALA